MQHEYNYFKGLQMYTLLLFLEYIYRYIIWKVLCAWLYTQWIAQYDA